MNTCFSRREYKHSYNPGLPLLGYLPSKNIPLPSLLLPQKGGQHIQFHPFIDSSAVRYIFNSVRRKAMDSNSNDNEKNHDADRRDFLRKSIYAAYATPLITALLVEEANAAPSCTGRLARRCSRPRNFCRRRCIRICGTICNP